MKTLKTFLFLCIFSLCIYTTSFAYTLADDFQYPISSTEWIYDPNIWSTCFWFSGQDFKDPRAVVDGQPDLKGRHLGEDWNYDCYDDTRSAWIDAEAGKPIYAIANSYVIISGIRQGFAGFLILKHYLPSGSYVLSIYGHLECTVSVNKNVEGDKTCTNLPKPDEFIPKGKVIANLASDQQMFEWTKYTTKNGEIKHFWPHLHFEIRGDKSQTGLNDTKLNDGYDSNGKGYFDPTDIFTWGVSASGDMNPQLGFIETHRKPAPPVFTKAQSTGSRTIELAWTKVDYATKYALRRWNKMIYCGPWKTTHKDDGSHLSPDTTYSYVIQAGNSMSICDQNNTTGFSDPLDIKYVTTQSVKPGSLKGTVKDSSSGLAVKDVLVEVGTKTPKTTNSSGYYEFPDIAPGAYSVRFSKSKFESYNTNVSISANKATTIPVVTIRQQGVAGTLRIGSTRGTALSGATVKSGSIRTTTDRYGKYHLPLPSTGTYKIEYMKDGYISYSKNITVTANKVTNAGDNYLMKK